jgi:hypothetical protein
MAPSPLLHDGGGSNEVGIPPLDLSPPPPLDLRDTAVARVPTNSGVLFPPPSDELEGDGSGDGAVCTLNSSPCCFISFFYCFFVLQ